MNFTITIREDGRVTRHGLETPRQTKVVARGTNSDGEYVIVIKVPGHTYWRGIGIPRGYAGVEYEVLAVRGESRLGDSYHRVERIRTFDPMEWRRAQSLGWKGVVYAC